jgi:predicted nucleotidyltransferase
MAKEKRDAMIGAMVPSAIKNQLQSIADHDARSLSFVAGALIERGLDLYKRDGQLRTKGKDEKLDVIRAKAEETPRRKTKQ